MPVTVRVPLRIVVDPPALAARLDDLGEAVTAATGRALANAVAVIDDTRGGYVTHRPVAPVLTWSGTALGGVPAQAREECERVVREAISRAVAENMPEPADTDRDSLAQRLTTDVTEIADAERMAALAGLYVIRGYQDGAPTAVEIHFGDEQGLRIRAVGATMAWRGIAIDPGMWDIFRDALFAYHGDPLPAQVGVIFQSGGTYYVYAQRSPGRELMADFSLPPLHTIEPEVTGSSVTAAGSVTLRDVPYVPSADASFFNLRFVGSANTAEQRSAVFREFFGANLSSAIQEEVRRLAPGSDAVAIAEARVTEIANTWAAAQEAWTSYIELEVDGLPFLIASDDSFPADMNVQLIPIVEPATGEPGGGTTGEGTGGDGRGGGERDGDLSGVGGPLGDSPEGRMLWPVSGVGGEELVCEAYLGEPSMEALVVDSFGLAGRMRRIARQLEIPECGYLGKFAINAARVLAARARGVGVACATATTMTEVTVRHDGSGNNGFVDVRPGQTPEFGYLRILAQISTEIHQFGLDVVSTYLDLRNAHLVFDRRGADEPDAAGWGLRYLNDFPEVMRNGFMHLYAETCRVLLLQQLRSSASGISARQARFEQTLESFSQTLDILGETVVQLATLRRAIAHSEDIVVTGTVRTVLSVPRTVAAPNGADVEETPPIFFVPTNILESVGDATIERRDTGRVAVFQGRPWTKDELDAAIGVRRSLINRIDPLFLQVSDLESLYSRSVADANFASTYLTNLLSEMARANEEMTRDASDPEDGSFFALEASQYIRREGGRDWRGLRFELQGIHALADEVLRPHIGDDHLYADGINDAIGRKANFDDFLAIFATAGIIVLGLLCAPLGAVAVAAVTGIAGLALTIHDVMEADRQTDLYRALENPELFLRWQEVQLAQMMAGLSIAFSVFDFIGVVRGARAIVGTARHALRVAERAGVGMAVRSIARSTRREIIRNMTREVLENAIREALTQAAIVAVMNQVLPMIITPILVPWLRRTAQEHGTLAEVDVALGELAAGLPPPALLPATTTPDAATDMVVP